MKLRVQGHPSAYGFYHGAGGDQFFQFSYNHYLMIESSKRLPSVDAFEKILKALFGNVITSRGPERREVCRAYLKAMAEGNPIFDIVWDAPDTKSLAGSAEDEAFKEMAKRKIHEVPRLSAEQTKVTFSSPTAFWCHQWLLQTGKTLSVKALAEAIRTDEESVAEALKVLKETKVLEKTRSGKYRSPFAESDVFITNPKFRDDQSIDLSRNIDNTKLEGGHHGYFFLTLETQKEFELLTEHFREAMRKAYLYRKKGPIKGPGFICSSEWRFIKLFEIPAEDS